MKILVFGLPEAGKTTFAKRLIKGTDFAHFNADEVRGMFNDWDFSEEGRRRQAQRMLALCTMANKTSPISLLRSSKFSASSNSFISESKSSRASS